MTVRSSPAKWSLGPRGAFGLPALIGAPLLVTVAAFSVVVLVRGFASHGESARLSGERAAPSNICTGARPPPRYAHVIWIFMENKSFEHVIGQIKNAPYENLLAESCGLALNYHDLARPSLPNYIGATSGSTWGIKDNSDPKDHPLDVPSIYSQLDGARLSWREYTEDAPGGCPQTDAGLYAVRHDPLAYYTRLRAECSRWDLPLGALAADLAHNSLPSFALVIPNLCHDTHDCPVQTGDDWLSIWLARILASQAFREGKTAVFLTWDEGEQDSHHVALIVIAPSVPRGTTSSQAFDHYSLLKTTEELLGLGFLGHAADPSTASLVGAFHLLPS